MIKVFNLAIALFVLALAAPATGLERFIDNGDGTVADRSSGLVWQQADSYLENPKPLSWYDALEYVDQKNADKLGGHSDWRLPSMDELTELWNPAVKTRSKDGEAIGLPKLFKDGGAYYLWSGDERSLDNAWYFGLGQKERYFNLKEYADLEQGARLVRRASARKQ